ncbi:2-succinyl-5-enolpyruvyl-6-hydroxy-3-cyclohexene-1-carboxylic-acid synthase [Halostella sp. JP-L12]|uniref:2-succinyl-5-enolpyruvyl-6-hydroxy-3- cyclohexene-1-carboxylic-acid synthase n=1 Tax=Halostella TaxID=1843185 RepID=UPI000EF7DFFE|nr:MULTISPECIES: 2-succinyl-5-enolpyruvyl-6-hydroxy-3-cyclohexene-1-carboxylic-acid synthase [Halostella]NHN49667.1 2-succinyl-5-enolpyruvyl-6-hydroxy-3-cyclohexene-1-carboxylic-acid synthase [Halostella sp. JP-L12]
MDAADHNEAWADALVAELAAGGVSAACVSPGSRSTPLTMAFARNEDVTVYSHLDERSAAYFALGRARRTGEVTPLVCTSGTAAANFHPAVIEATQARVPLLLLTADRPPELRDSGANQTVDQEKLYGDAVRWYADLPEPRAEGRTLRSLRTTAARALAEATGTPAGPVHLNCPFRKRLEPPEGTENEERRTTASERPHVRTTAGTPTLGDDRLADVADAVEAADHGLVVAGPADGAAPDPSVVAAFAESTGFPLLADPLSGVRYGPHVADAPVVGGYDAFLTERVTADWPDPDLVVRFGASPTSKPLRKYLARTGARQLVVDPAGGWREAEFAASDLVVADPERLLARLSDRIDSSADPAWRDRFAAVEDRYWSHVADAREERRFEGDVLATVVEAAPDPATLFVSNSMPVRDLDRFGAPRAADLILLGNRGASGIDGIVSTALGAGSATEDPLVLVTGDLAFYHDMNGLLAVGRCGVDATIVVVNNDGGGIFHMLPVEDFDPPFTEQFKTPHGLDFAPAADLYGLEFTRVRDRDAFRETYRASLSSDGTQVIEVPFDAERSHREREAIQGAVVDALGD